MSKRAQPTTDADRSSSASYKLWKKRITPPSAEAWAETMDEATIGRSELAELLVHAIRAEWPWNTITPIIKAIGDLHAFAAITGLGDSPLRRVVSTVDDRVRLFQSTTIELWKRLVGQGPIADALYMPFASARHGLFARAVWRSFSSALARRTFAFS